MAFTSLPFLALTAGALLIYCAVPKRLRWGVLLAASFIFYWTGGGLTVMYVLYTALTVYIATLALGALEQKRAGLPPDERKVKANYFKRLKRLMVLAAVITNFGLLYYLKYWSFTVSILNRLGAGLTSRTILLPLGISFFMFQSVGYVVDVYRGKVQPERNLLKLLLFVSFFPQMVQGPISRFGDLMPQLTAGERPSADDIKEGLQLAMWGYLKKLVIADRAAVLVNTVMNSPWSYGGAVIASGVFFYCIQLYGDFSGGIDITRGVSRMFGIGLTENFRRPLFATSLTDFWRRWHITLGAWMRDYVFYPISLSKPFGKLGKFTRKKIGGKLGKLIPTSLATFIVYFIIGIWHGANMRYIAFGFWNGTLITASLLMAPTFTRWKDTFHIQDTAPWYKAFQIMRTAFLVFLGRYITRAPRLLTGLWMIKETFLHPRFGEIADGMLLKLGISAFDIAVVLVGISLVVAAEWVEEKGVSIRAEVDKKSLFVQWLAILAPLLAIYLLGLLRGDHISADFIYKQF